MENTKILNYNFNLNYIEKRVNFINIFILLYGISFFIIFQYLFWINTISFSNLFFIIVGSLFLNIIISFFYFLFRPSKEIAFYSYIHFLLFIFFIYMICFFSFTFFLTESIANFGFEFEFYILWTADINISCLIIFLFGLLTFILLYIDSLNNTFYTIELPFLLALLFWFFLITVFCYNLFFLFLVIEAITLTFVVIITLYFIFIGPKLLQSIIKFFILNLIISTFFLFGIGLLLFIYVETAPLSYITFYALLNKWVLFWNCWVCGQDNYLLLIFIKSTILFIISTFSFKLTLAPFSIWVIQIYSKLPSLFLFILITIYKIIYFIIFLKLFISILSSFDLIQIEVDSIYAATTIYEFFTSIILIIAVPSIFVGCFAYRHHDLKTILAYTTVSQIGYIITGSICSTISGIKFSLIYLFIYCIQLAGIFIIFIICKYKYEFNNVNQLYLIIKYNKFFYYCLFIIFFSLAGIPPLSGFFIKYFLFLEIYKSGFFITTFIGLLTNFLIIPIYLYLNLQLVTIKNYPQFYIFQYNKINFQIILILNYNRIKLSQYIIIIFNFLLLLLLIINTLFYFILPIIDTILLKYTYILIFELSPYFTFADIQTDIEIVGCNIDEIQSAQKEQIRGVDTRDLDGVGGITSPVILAILGPDSKELFDSGDTEAINKRIEEVFGDSITLTEEEKDNLPPLTKEDEKYVEELVAAIEKSSPEGRIFADLLRKNYNIK